MASPGSLVYNSEFTADTTAAKQSLKDYQTQIRAVRDEIKQQTQEARENYRIQMLAAKAAGAGPEELNRITQEYNRTLLSAKNAQTKLTDEILKGNYSALEAEKAIQVVRQQALETIDAQTAAIRAYAEANQTSHTISNQTAASGFVQLADGRGGIRTVENFLGNTLGLGGVFGMLFPVIGAIQAGKLLVDLGEKVYEVGHSAANAGQKIGAAFDQLHFKSQVTIDDLTVQADKIQDNIDKLSGHPSNGLRTALDEAKVSADKLLTSLQSDRKELEALLKEHSVSAFGTLLTGVAGTGIQKTQILDDNKALQDRIAGINSQFNAESANAKTLDDIKTAGQKRDNAIRGAVQATITTYRTEANRLKAEQDRSADVAAGRSISGGPGTAAGVIDNSAKIANINGVAQKYQDYLNTFNAQTRLADLTEQELALKGQKASAEQSAEASRKATAAQRQQIEQWKKLQTQVRETQNESSRLSTQYNKDSTGLANDFDSNNQRDQAQQLAVASRMTADFVKSLQSLSAATVSANRAAAEQAITQNLADGKITAYDAAVQRQTLHTNEYTEALQNLKDALAAVSGDSLESNTRRNNIQSQIVELNARRSGESIQDQAAVAQNTVSGALKNANTKWLQDTQNIAPQIANAYTQALSGFNDQLSNLLTGQKTSWSSFFSGIATMISKIGLNSLESSLASSTTGSSLGGLVRGVFGGARAGGGGVEAGKTYLVGEHGPELATFGSNAYITPNNKIGGAFGSSHHWNIAVDARGSTNPAEVEAAAHRAVMTAAPHIVAASLQAQKDQQARSPYSKK